MIGPGLGSVHRKDEEVSFDYLMNQIETMTRALALVVMGQEQTLASEMFESDGRVSPELFLQNSLEKLLAEGKVNQAENLLFQMLDQQPSPAFLTTGLGFYQTLLEMEEEKLQELGFSGEEIAQGLEDLARRFPLPPSEAERPQ